MFAVNDIVLPRPGVRPAGAFLITGVTNRPKNRYDAVLLGTAKTYHLSDEFLSEKRIAVLESGAVAAPTGAAAVSEHSNENGAMRARAEMRRLTNGSAEWHRWKLLSEAKAGDKIKIRRRTGTEEVTFRNVTDRGYKYVFTATNRNGTTYRYPLAVILLPDGVQVGGRETFTIGADDIEEFDMD